MSLSPGEIGVVSEAPRPIAAMHPAPHPDQFAKSLAKAARVHPQHPHGAKALVRPTAVKSGEAAPSVAAQAIRPTAASVVSRVQPAVNGKPNTAPAAKTGGARANATAPAVLARQAAATGQAVSTDPSATDAETNAATADTSDTTEPADLSLQTTNPEPPAPPVLTGALGTVGNASPEPGSAADDGGDAAAEPAALALANAEPGAGAKPGTEIAIDPGLAPKPAAAAPTEPNTPVPVAPPAATPVATAMAHQAAEAPAQSETPAPAPPTVQVGVSLLRSALGLEQQVFTLSLRPERLGGVDVRLEVDRQGRARATFTAEKSDTLQILRQDAHHLVSTLKQAGLDADASSISFSLKDPEQGKSSFAQDRGASSRGCPNGAAADEDRGEAVEAPAIASNRLYDIRA